MLAGRKHVLEVGCADAFGTRIVQQAVGKVTAIDFDPLFIADVKERMNPHWPLEVFVHDMLQAPVPGEFDAAYALDVLEHIPEKPTRITSSATSIASLTPDAASRSSACRRSSRRPMPRRRARPDTSTASRARRSRRTLERHFHTVFVFSMNDEVVHTGFYPMAHYLLGIGCHRRDAA